MSDYISREAALAFQDELAVLLCKDVVTGDVMSATKDADLVKYLLSIQAADVRPVVKSKWADNHVSFYRGCPECGAFVRANLDEVFLRDFPSAVGKLNFCPNCGADMREES